MRAKKAILLIDSNEDRRSARAFMLYVNGYKVVDETASECDLVVACWPCSPKVKDEAIQRGAKILLLVPKPTAKTRVDESVDHILWGASCEAATVLERVKFLSAGKTGPPKGVARPPRPAVQATA